MVLYLARFKPLKTSKTAHQKVGLWAKSGTLAVPGLEWAKACYRVLKPGGHIIAFGATRSIHRLTVAVEDAGFEIRDMIAWCQYQGFPKSQNISADIDRMAGVEREIVGHQKLGGTARSGLGKQTTGSIGGYDIKKESIPITKPATEDAIRWEGFGTGLKPLL